MKKIVLIALLGVFGLTGCVKSIPIQLEAGERAKWPPKVITVVYKDGRRGHFCDPDGDGTYTPCPVVS